MEMMRRLQCCFTNKHRISVPLASPWAIVCRLCTLSGLMNVPFHIKLPFKQAIAKNWCFVWPSAFLKETKDKQNQTAAW